MHIHSRSHADKKGMQCLPKLVRKPSLDMSPPAIVRHEQADFIKDNALAVIHQQPQQPASKQQPDSMDKPDFGKVPEYLKAAKLKLQQDKAAKEEEQRVRAQQVTLLHVSRASLKRHFRGREICMLNFRQLGWLSHSATQNWRSDECYDCNLELPETEMSCYS